MDSITELIKTEIKKQYKSLKQFSEESNIPYSTLTNALTKGIGGTSFDTVVKICNLLKINQIYNDDLMVFNDQFYDVCLMLSKLDEQGAHTVKTVLAVEYNRCQNAESQKKVRGFSGMVFASEPIDSSIKDKDLKDMIAAAKRSTEE